MEPGVGVVVRVRGFYSDWWTRIGSRLMEDSSAQALHL